MRRVAVACVVLLSLVGCSNDEDGSTTTTTGAVVTSTTLPFGTTPVSSPANTAQGVITRVQVGAHEGFTRVVFAFSNLVPGFAVQSAQPPFVQDGSGATVEVSGDGHLAVRLTARAHDDAGKPSYPGGQRTRGAGNVTEVVRTGDFEGVVNFVIGTKAAPSFRVFTLSGPTRLVIDIAT